MIVATWENLVQMKRVEDFYTEVKSVQNAVDVSNDFEPHEYIQSLVEWARFERFSFYISVCQLF